MNKFFAVLAVTAITGMLGTGAGGFLAATVKSASKRVIGLLLALAAGVTLGTVCLDFIPEALHRAAEHGNLSIIYVALCIAVGYVAVYVFDRLAAKRLHHNHSSHCHSECECCSDAPQKMIRSGTVLAISIAIHNLPVGIVLGASMATDTSAFVSAGILATALAIVVHNVPEGMAVALPFILGGMKKPLAVLSACACGITTVVGGMLGFCLGSVSPLALTLMLGFAAGAMLFVIFNELILEAFSHARLRWAAISVFVGLLISITVLFLSGHNHIHGHI